MVISCARASGYTGAFDLQLLPRRSIILTRATLRTRTARVLSESRRAHEDLERRGTAGAAKLVPLTRFAPTSRIGRLLTADRARRRDESARGLFASVIN
jgi:hypothetical protein